MKKRTKRFNLLAETYRLLDASNESITGIARDADINYHWLVKFNRRHHRNPGVVSVQELYDYLSNKAKK